VRLVNTCGVGIAIASTILRTHARASRLEPVVFARWCPAGTPEDVAEVGRLLGVPAAAR
jgi:hypothetical protein